MHRRYSLFHIQFRGVCVLYLIIFLVLPAYTIGIDDGKSVSYHKKINATCVENKLADRFSGWKLDLPKPIDEIEVKISRTKTSTSKKNFANLNLRLKL